MIELSDQCSTQSWWAHDLFKAYPWILKKIQSAFSGKTERSVTSCICFCALDFFSVTVPKSVLYTELWCPLVNKSFYIAKTKINWIIWSIWMYCQSQKDSIYDIFIIYSVNKETVNSGLFHLSGIHWPNRSVTDPLTGPDTSANSALKLTEEASISACGCPLLMFINCSTVLRN